MRKQIFRALVCISLLVMASALVVSLCFLDRYFSRMAMDQLKRQTSFVGGLVDDEGTDRLTPTRDLPMRVTLVAPDGTVLFDNKADAATMENHADRTEIQEAMASGTGSVVRWSSTLSSRTLYAARRLRDGSVLRLSVTNDTVFRLTAGMIPSLLVVVALMLALALVLSRKLTRSLMRPLDHLDLSRPLANDTYEELTPLLTQLDAQQRTIRDQIATMEERQKEFTAITGGMSEAFVLLDREGIVLSSNQAACTLFAIQGDPVGRPFSSLVRDGLFRTLLGKGHGEGLWERNGRTWRVLCNTVAERGEVLGSCLILLDETEKIQLEARRKEFSANVSHELKSPLHAILASCELLEHDLVRQADVRTFITRIDKEAKRLLALVEDTIRISQLDEQPEYPKETVPLKALVDEVVGNLQETARERKVALRTEGDDVTCRGVRHLLYEIVGNLVDNAIKYSKPEGGTVTVRVTAEGADARITVQDTGIGIPPEAQGRIFERFYRVDRSHSRQTGGTGLGLSIVKHAVMVQGGTVQVQSELGKGTTMTVVLPR